MLLHSSWITQAIKAALDLRVFDALFDTPQSAPDLALTLKCHPDALARLLQALATLELCATDASSRWTLTPLGDLLSTSAPGSLQPWAQFWCGPTTELWRELATSVRQGVGARQFLEGAENFDHLAGDSRRARQFNAAMTALTHWVARSFAERVELGAVRVLVDVGGGHGEMLVQALARHPALRGIVFDLPHATSGAPAYLTRHGVADRVQIVAGDFFVAVPAGADAYLLKSVLHNWTDDRCTAILRSCHTAMQGQGRLFVVERLLPRPATASVADREGVRSDLNMLVALGARERTADEYRGLLRSAGFEVTTVGALAMGIAVIEARCA
jgi:hypothetical protein